MANLCRDDDDIDDDKGGDINVGASLLECTPITRRCARRVIMAIVLRARNGEIMSVVIFFSCSECSDFACLCLFLSHVFDLRSNVIYQLT